MKRKELRRQIWREWTHKEWRGKYYNWRASILQFLGWDK